MLKNVSLAKKQLGGFLLVSIITIIVTATGIFGVQAIQANFIRVVQTAPLIDGAMEMKIAVARDMQMIMELLAGDSKKDLDEIWKEHEGFVRDFDVFADAILNGAETEEGMIYAAEDAALLNIVSEAEKFHDREFQPRIKQIYEMMSARIAGDPISEEKLGKLDAEADRIGENILEMIGEIEDQSRDAINAAVLDTDTTVSLELKILLFTGIAGVLLSIGLGVGITRMIAGPVKKATEFAKIVAGGDLTQHIDIDQKDEIGILIGALNDMSGKLRIMFKDITLGAQSLNTSSTELSAASSQISSNSEMTAEKSNTVAAAAEEMSANMNAVSAATEEATANIQMIVSAAEEMAATIQEISRNTTRGEETTRNAVSYANKVAEEVKALDSASLEITKVTDTIADISEQTNLLALNATIEASRAGDAGKGFAVVAGEIKELAKQTAEATDEINAKINLVQDTTKNSVKSIEGILEIINEINEIVVAMASSIEEQAATTQEINRSVSNAAEGLNAVNENMNQISAVTAEVTRSVAEVSLGAGETNSGSIQVKDSSGRLLELAENLNGMVRQFAI